VAGPKLRKKLRERRIFDRVRRLLPDWAAGTVDDKGEEPDIVVTTNAGDRFGVEVTEFVRASSLRLYGWLNFSPARSP
jgi:hypothetical protein